MEGLLESRRGGILGLRRFVNEHAEAIAVDLLAVGRSIHEIGRTISWFEIKAWIAKPPESSVLLRDLRYTAAEERERQKNAALPEDRRTVGSRADAMPIDEFDAWWASSGGRG